MRVWRWILERLGLRRRTMNSEELLKRIAEDVTDEDIDRLLPPSLRKQQPKRSHAMLLRQPVRGQSKLKP